MVKIMDWLNASISSKSVGDHIFTNSTIDSRKIVPAVVLGLCCFVGLPSNIAVIISIARELNRNLSFTLKLMVNLAVSDALTLSLAPFGMYGILFGWTLGIWSCRILFYLGYNSMYVSVFTVTAMSVHRYNNVIKSKITNRIILQRLEESRRWLKLTDLWIVAFAFALPVLFTRGIKGKNGLLRCQRAMETPHEEVTVLLLEIMLGFVIPLSVMLVCYLWLHKGLRQTAKSSKGYKKRLVISIVVAFFIFWTPVHVINVLDIMTTITEMSNSYLYNQLKSFRRVSGDTSKTLALINCCLNHFLYANSSRNLMKCHNRKK
ncbi:leukotriene B4 receptor 1-like [Myxocyprinus asiaticus]|uniref:leukotriene B4 receptor 1-like n=1 Tax=Myxocyprinus asiaticus TaxID=70543 RepID=UPI0022214596|nr:leukotriene B4 receptor 1-like [Myxocyprinus asiaticus]XP_051512835.1 leukotriene B4 receptor 1-like [Myxocyprinus asiaticus]